MKYYAVVEVDVTDPAWVRAYVENVTKMVESYDGRYLARTDKIERIEGERNTPQLLVIVEWPSETVAKEFYQSEEYRPYRQSRINGAKNHLVLAAGEDTTGTAKMSD